MLVLCGLNYYSFIGAPIMTTLELYQTILRLAKAGKPMTAEVIACLEADVKGLQKERAEKRKSDRRLAQRLFAGLNDKFDHLYTDTRNGRIFAATVGPRIAGTRQACMLWGLGPLGRDWGPRMIAAETELVEFAKR